MRGAIPPLPQYVFIPGCIVKHRVNLIFTFLPLNNSKKYLICCCCIVSQNVICTYLTHSQYVLDDWIQTNSGPTQPPIQYVAADLFPGGKAAGA
jgi:hypothetical protein